MFFQPITVVGSFLHLMVLLFKVSLNHTSKHQFLALHFRKVSCPVYFIVFSTELSGTQSCGLLVQLVIQDDCRHVRIRV